MLDDVHPGYFNDLIYSREAVLKYLDKLQPADRVAFFTVSGMTGVDFTSDRTKIFRRLSTPECHYVLAFVPTVKADGKFHQLKVKLEKKGKFTVEARNRYYAPARAE